MGQKLVQQQKLTQEQLQTILMIKEQLFLTLKLQVKMFQEDLLTFLMVLHMRMAVSLKKFQQTHISSHLIMLMFQVTLLMNWKTQVYSFNN